MSIVRIALALCTVGGLCHAATPSAIASKVTSTLQGKSRVGVVCDYSANETHIREIAACLDPSIHMVVVDSHTMDDINSACGILRRKEVDCLLVLSNNGPFCPKSPSGKLLANRIKRLGLPIVNASQI